MPSPLDDLPVHQAAAPLPEPATSDTHFNDGYYFAFYAPGVHAFCTPGDAAILPVVLDAAEQATPMSPAERAAAIDELASEEVIFPLVEKAVR